MTETFEQALRDAGQAQIAKELGISRQAVNCWATRRQLVPFKHVEWLAQRLEVSPADIRPDLARIMGQEAAAE